MVKSRRTGTGGHRTAPAASPRPASHNPREFRIVIMSSESQKGNERLREFYEKIYEDGEENYFSKFKQGVDASETNEVVLDMVPWSGKSVLDVGCGTGSLLREILSRGARRVTGVDYSEKAIEIARARTEGDKAEFVAGNIFDMPVERHDVVVSCGTMEHSDEPARFLEALSARCSADGWIVVTCPHFINVRGFVWMALAKLHDVPMSLTDLHFLHPWEIGTWCTDLGLQVDRFVTFDHARGNGADLVNDFDKRLTNALRDAGMDNSRVPEYLQYLGKLVEYLERASTVRLEGATAAYLIKRATSPANAP